MWPEGIKYEKFNKKTIPPFRKMFSYLGAKSKNQVFIRAFEILAYFISDSKWFLYIWEWEGIFKFHC